MTDMTNLKVLETYQDGTVRIRVRFKYKHPLTGLQKVHQKILEPVTAEDARKYRDETRTMLLNPDSHLKSHRLKDFIDSYQTQRILRGKRGKKLRYATLKSEAQVLDHVIRPTVGDWVVEKITRRDCNNLLNDWLMLDKPGTTKRYSRWTINNWWKAFRQLLKFACLEIGLERSPAEGLDGVPTEQKNAVAHTAEEARKVLARLRQDDFLFYVMVLIGYVTGARFSAVSALHWTDINSDSGIIEFNRSQYQGVISERDKTGRKWWFPLADLLESELMELRRQLVREQHPGLSSGLVFPSTVGKPIWPSRVRDVLDAVCKSENVPRVTFHNLRDTFNTISIETGLSGADVRSVTGHQTEEMTMHYYHPHVEARLMTFTPVIEQFRVNEG